MLQDIQPHSYNNAFQKYTVTEGDILLSYRGKEILCKTGNAAELPTWIEAGCPPKTQFAFAIDDTRYFLSEGEPLPESEELRYCATKADGASFNPVTMFAVAAGETLDRWYRNNRFCGRCGAETGKSTTERALVCPKCGKIAYPLICPGVIVGVVDGDKLLLTKYSRGTFRKYALIAGFTEFGETIEDTVRREVLEEVGLHATDLRFYKSQPWPYSDTLLMGFFCKADSRETITLEEDELGEATWFTRSELPLGGSATSLTSEMIEYFRAHEDIFG